ncbi:hypothetical protein BJX63DRAFT_140379 [Aspergillus granulosus]|uniref:Uncharacterized protein n=1 Tax=Aspergillus granulosus TaxID=176169 RepID=A0ABR4GSP1_9EURO
MDERGYSEVTSRPSPDATLVTIGEDVLNYLASSSDTVKYADSANYPVGIKKQWQIFMENGINLEVNLLSHFESTRRVIRQGPIICSLASPSGAEGCIPRRAHPCPGAISIWKPVWGTGLLKVYPGSHQLETIEELRESQLKPIELRLYPDRVLFTRGSLWIEEGSGAGYLMWMGVSLSIVGLHIDTYSLTFIALAYGASRFLFRQLPPGRIEVGDEELVQRHLSNVPRNRLQSGSGGRSESAEDVLKLSLEDIPMIDSFLSELGDPTRLILSANYAATDNPRTAFIICQRSQNPNDWLMRALAVQFLVQEYHNGSYASITEFLREAHLPDTRQTRTALENGLKMDHFETPGLWIVMMRIFPRFRYLPFAEVYQIPQLLVRYDAVKVAGSRWTRFMEDSIRLYSIWIGNLRDDR